MTKDKKIDEIVNILSEIIINYLADEKARDDIDKAE